jgi:hypothetical protein
MPSAAEESSSSKVEEKKDQDAEEEQSPQKRRKLSSRIDLGEITDKNIGQLKLLNAVIFPVQYREDFYKGVLASPDLTRLGQLSFLFLGSIGPRVHSQSNFVFSLL